MTRAAPRLVAIVTARGGSKGLPGKNLAPLGGLPLVAHSLRAGLDCPAVSRVVLTTDDPAIAAVGREWGVTVVDRPAALATDSARSQDAVRHALDVLAAAGEDFDLLALLQPTSPLRSAAHLSACVAAFQASDAACAISVSEETHPPHKAFTLDRDGWLAPLFGVEALSAARQTLPRTYRQNGAIYLIGCEAFRAADSFFIPPALPFLMSPEDSVDIDAALDMEWARFLLARRG